MLRRTLGGTRLLTLAGPGGAGKTRLAIELATALAADYPGGSSFVALAAVGDPSMVPLTVAAAVGVREVAGATVLATVAGRLRDRRCLIVLDNCEHLVAACALAADELLRAIPGLSIIATSREPLGVPGETVHQVPPLALPADSTADALAESEAARLFVERARAISSTFEVTSENSSAIAEICRRLDGIPLAIELAAARIAILSPSEIARRLDDRFVLLTGGPRTASSRQRTLRALIDWSHDLLTDDERIVFRRAAVFPGGLTFEAAEAAASGAGSGAPEDVLELLTGLVSKSLLTVERTKSTRYRMLETIRAYATERLAESGEEADVRGRQAAWCLELARAAEPALVSARQREWFDRLTVEHDNIGAALTWSLEHEPMAALEIAKCLYWFWQARGHLTEGRRWLDDSLARSAAADDDLRASALLGAGSLAWGTGHDATATRQLSESADIFRRLGDDRGGALALAILSHARVAAGDLVGARAAIEAALPLARTTGDLFVTARTLGALADLARHEGRDAEVVEAASEALELFTQLGMDEGVAFNLSYRASGLRRSDPSGACRDLVAAVELFVELDIPMGLSAALLDLLSVAPAAPETRATLLGAIDRSNRRAGSGEDVIGGAVASRVKQEAVGLLGAARYEELVAAGTNLRPDEVVQVSRSLIGTNAGGSP